MRLTFMEGLQDNLTWIYASNNLKVLWEFINPFNTTVVNITPV